MAYTKTTWTNNVTPLNATNMNKIENELEALDTGKLDAVTTAGQASVYGHNGSTQNQIALATTPANGEIPVYDANNNLQTSAPSANDDCANKSYTDTQDALKVDKVTTAAEVAAYIHNGSTQTVKVIDNTPTANAIPMYDANSRIKTVSPNANDDCANKSYVDSATGPLADSDIDDIL